MFERECRERGRLSLCILLLLEYLELIKMMCSCSSFGIVTEMCAPFADFPFRRGTDTLYGLTLYSSSNKCLTLCNSSNKPQSHLLVLSDFLSTPGTAATLPRRPPVQPLLPSILTHFMSIRGLPSLWFQARSIQGCHSSIRYHLRNDSSQVMMSPVGSSQQSFSLSESQPTNKPG